MAYFPFFIDIHLKKCYIIGGGKIAFRKIEALLEFGADITVIAPKIMDSIYRLNHQLNIITKEYDEMDIKDAFLVIAATNDSELNSRISRYCMDNRIQVNVVDEKEKCSFLFPAYVKRGDLVAGITTAGKSPMLSSHIKQTLQSQIPEEYEHMVKLLGDYRSIVKDRITSPDLRAKIMIDLVRAGIEQGGVLSEAEAENILIKWMN